MRAAVVESSSTAGPPGRPVARAAAPAAPVAARSRQAARGGRPVTVRSFVAVGDSFSEGVGDPWPDGSGCRGWADRLAEILAGQTAGLRYANLAIRGKTLGEVADDQVPAAAAMRPDLVTIAAGGNDLLRARADPDLLAEPFNQAVEQLIASGSRVLIFAGFNPSVFPLIRMIRGRAAIFNAHLRAIARRHDCLLVDLWGMRVLNDPRMWCEDRLHLSPEGHRRVALRTAEELGVPVEASWREPLPAVPRAGGAVPAWLAARRLDVRVGPGLRRALGAPPRDRGLQRRRHVPQAPRPAAPAAARPGGPGRPGDHGLRSASMSSIPASAAAIHGRASGSGAASAASRCSSVSPYSRPVASRSRRSSGRSPKALAGSDPAPYRSTRWAARSSPVTMPRRRSGPRHAEKSGYR